MKFYLPLLLLFGVTLSEVAMLDENRDDFLGKVRKMYEAEGTLIGKKGVSRLVGRIIEQDKKHRFELDVDIEVNNRKAKELLGEDSETWGPPLDYNHDVEEMFGTDPNTWGPPLDEDSSTGKPELIGTDPNTWGPPLDTDSTGLPGSDPNTWGPPIDEDSTPLPGSDPNTWQKPADYDKLLGRDKKTWGPPLKKNIKIGSDPATWGPPLNNGRDNDNDKPLLGKDKKTWGPPLKKNTKLVGGDPATWGPPLKNGRDNLTSSTCGGNCPSGNCPSCPCGTTKLAESISTWCGKHSWGQKCCQCIVQHESGGNAHADNYNSNGSFDVGLWQINDFNWNACNSGNAPCTPTSNLNCAIDVYNWGGKTWKLWSTCSVCGCCSSP